MELLPCPFCGAGTTRVVMNGQTWTGTKYSDPISVSVIHHCDPVEGQPSRLVERVGRDEESAIAAWNRRASPASAPEGWKHSCNALCMDAVELWIPQCPHCGKPGPTPPVSEDREDAELWRDLVSHQKFNNVPTVGYAINQAKKRQSKQEDKP